MTVVTEGLLSEADIDAVALKPSEVELSRAVDLDVDRLTIDFEGREHVPAAEELRTLAEEFDVRVTIPVRADGFDPFGEDRLRNELPTAVGEVLVAGHPAYLSEAEQKRAIAPRLQAARAAASRPWIGTEGIERVALAIGGTQFDLLSNSTPADVRALRAAGFDDDIAVYAPTVLTEDDDAVLDAVGEYAARRQRVAEGLADDTPRDSSATGDTRKRLLAACHEYALVGNAETVAGRVEELRTAGVDYVVSYPARGLDSLLA